MKRYDNHLSAMTTLANLASQSTDINMRSKAATINWLKNEFAALERERDLLAEDVSAEPMAIRSSP